MPPRTVSIVLAAAALAAAAARAQPPAPPQIRESPSFRTGIALLRVDAAVVDESERAIPDLTATDFRVEIDGKPRAVAFARFTGAGTTPPAIAADAVNNDPHGRAIAVVVDLASIRSGSERPLLDTAAQLIEKLRPSDAVGLVAVPGAIVDLTRDHARVATALRALRGTSDAPLARYYVTLDEALAFERRDKRVIDEVVERECARDVEAVAAANNLPPVCPPALEIEARDRLWFERQHIETVLAHIVNLAQQLRTVKAPTTILLISGGLGFDQESYARFEQAQAALKDAGVAIYSVQVDQREIEASASRPAKAGRYSSRDRETGLANLATMAGGVFFPGVGRAQGVFERLRTELTEAYELAVEAEPGDFDGKPHEVRITTTRKATVHARRYAAVAPPAADWAARLANLLAQPVDVGGLPIAIAPHSVRGEEAATLKVLIRADVGHGVPTTPPVRYAAVVVGTGGAVVMNLTGTTAASGGVLLSTQLAPGRYRLRMAALDGGGREGTLDMPLIVGIRAAASLQLSDLIVGTNSGGALTPSIFAPAGEPLIPTLELSTDDSARFAATTVGFEVRRARSEEVVATGTGRLEETAYERQQIARGVVPTAGMEPGPYTLSAVIKVDGQPAGRVSRSFILEPPAAAPAPTPAPAEPPRPAEAAAPVRPADPMLDDVMHKAAGYVAAYGERMSVVVGIERYTQYVNPIGGATTRPRRLLAEFALVKSGGPVPWTGYRDVIEVNGEPVTDRRDRIVQILTESADPLEEASRLTAESARYNIGPVSRNFNLPTTALFFFHESNLSRFTFTRKGTKKIDGVETLEIAFRETARPTLIATRGGSDVPAAGTLWVVPDDGTIVRTRLQLKGFADSVAMGETGAPIVRPPSATPQAPATVPPAPAPAPPSGTPPAGASGSGTTAGSPGSAAGTGRGSTAGDANVRGLRSRFADFPDASITELESTAEIEVTYHNDDRLGMWLPAQMSEEYQGAIPLMNRPPVLGTARSRATYSDYKRFGTSAVTIGPKK